MDNDKFLQTYIELGIPVQTLPPDYTPEEYGRRLFSMSQTERGVSYAASTDYVETPQTTLVAIKDKDGLHL